MTRAIALLAAGLAIGSCAKKATSPFTDRPHERVIVDAAGAATGSIAGVVRWKDDGQPAAGVYVTAFPMEPSMASLPNPVVTDALGGYLLSGLSPGEYTVTADHVDLKKYLVDGGPQRVATVQAIFPRKGTGILVAGGQSAYDLTVSR